MGILSQWLGYAILVSTDFSAEYHVYGAGPLGCHVHLVQQVGPDGARAPHYMLKNTWLPQPTARSAHNTAGTNASTETESEGTGSQIRRIIHMGIGLNSL